MAKAKESSRSHFDRVDTDRDGRVSVSDLNDYIVEQFRMSYGDAAELVSRMDQDGDGVISFAEFETHYDVMAKPLE